MQKRLPAPNRDRQGAGLNLPQDDRFFDNATIAFANYLGSGSAVGQLEGYLNELFQRLVLTRQPMAESKLSGAGLNKTGGWCAWK